MFLNPDNRLREVESIYRGGAFWQCSSGVRRPFGHQFFTFLFLVGGAVS